MKNQNAWIVTYAQTSYETENRVATQQEAEAKFKERRQALRVAWGRRCGSFTETPVTCPSGARAVRFTAPGQEMGILYAGRLDLTA